MVRLTTLGMVVALAVAAPATTQAQNLPASVDWRRAGGDLFAAGADPAPQTPIALEADPERLVMPEQPYAIAITEAAARHGLDEKLLHALVVVESAYRPEACSPVGACGLTQLMPGTAAELGVRDRFAPRENLQGGAAYLAQQIVRFGDVRLALAAYNSGPARVARLGRIPDIAETRAYVSSVIDCYLALSAGRGVRTSRDCVARGSWP